MTQQTTVRHTERDFARVPWRGVAVNEDGRRAIRVPSPLGSLPPWSVHTPRDADTTRHWCTDANMASEPGWRILPTVTPAPVPEPWETAPYVIVTHKDGEVAVMKSTGDGCLDHHGGYWTRSQIASMNPRPFDPTEVQE